MPSKPRASAPASVSNALVPVGARHLSAKRRQPKRDENGDKPTTARALVLRNGKHGARGTGEIVLVTKLLGREKLDLLAEDLTEKSKTAVLTPFNLSTCLKIADSQCGAFLDEIANLQDPTMFTAIIEAEWESRKPLKDPSKGEPNQTPSAMAKVVGNKIHNTYLLASAWRIVSDTLHDLEDGNLSDGAQAKLDLKRNEALRAKYIFLYQFVSTLVKITQEGFSLLATTTPHYAQYFKIRDDTDDPSEQEYIFDWIALKEAGKSFLDSIILEMCFPSAPYPMTVLYQILHDAVEESPKEAKRFPQALWDAVGDLSVSVELQALLEAPLLGADTAGWKDAIVEKPAQYERWLDAQYLSAEASDRIANFKDIISPLAKAKKKAVLDNMWKNVNLNYKEVSGHDIDSLWQVQDALARTPQWHALDIPRKALQFDSDDEWPPAKTGKNAPRGKPLQITQGEDSDDSMPPLQSVSNSSDEDDSDDLLSEEDDDDNDDSNYDEEYEYVIHDMVQDAISTAHDYDLLDDPQSFDAELGKGNSFLKMLESLSFKRRFIKRNPKLNTGTPAPRNPKTGFFGKVKTGPPPPPQKPEPVATPAPAPVPQDQRATVEEVKDEDDIQEAGDEDDSPSTPKKKKKKKAKKKKASTTTSLQEIPEPATIPPPSAPASPATKKPSQSPVANVAAQMSNISLLPVEQMAPQSAHSYLKAEKLLEAKAKSKSRGLDSASEKRGGFMSKFKLDKSKTEKVKEEKKPKHNWFSGLKKKTAQSMHRLLRTSQDETKGTAPMKWDVFVKLMKDMGFECVPSAAGSRVRFDPPRPNVSITLHKPHPDKTIQPTRLRDIAKTLKSSYGWTEADFLAAQ